MVSYQIATVEEKYFVPGMSHITTHVPIQRPQRTWWQASLGRKINQFGNPGRKVLLSDLKGLKENSGGEEGRQGLL